MTLPQQQMIDRITQLCRDDPRLEAAMLYGSFTWGEGDQYSDIDCLLFFEDQQLPEINPKEWLNQLAPVKLYYKNEFDNGVAIFNNLVRGEFHFDPVSEMHSLSELKGKVTFPSLETTILVDKAGQLTSQLLPLLGQPPDMDMGQQARFLCNSLVNWTLFGLNVLERGEVARAWELLCHLHDTLLRLVRMVEGQTDHWLTPTRSAEKEISPAAYERLVRCSANMDAEELNRAYYESWSFGQELAAAVAKRHRLSLPTGLMEEITLRFFL